MYTYINAVLDANPMVARLELPDTGATGPYDIVTGPVPVGERSIPGRVTVTVAVEELSVCTGYDLSSVVVVRFIP